MLLTSELPPAATGGSCKPAPRSDPEAFRRESDDDCEPITPPDDRGKPTQGVVDMFDKLDMFKLASETEWAFDPLVTVLEAESLTTEDEL